MAHGHEARARHVGIGRERRLELRLVLLHLGEGSGKPPRHDVAAFLDRGVVGARVAGRHPEGRVRLLHGLGAGGGGGELPVLALVRDIALPELLQQRDHLQHHRHAEVLVHASREAIELALVGPATDAELEPAARDEIEQGRLPCKLDGMPVRRHHHRGAEPDAPSVRGKVGEELEGAGRDRHLQRVVLRRPYDLETGPVGELHHRRGVLQHLHHVGVRTEALHVDDEVELHGNEAPRSVSRLLPGPARAATPGAGREHGVESRLAGILSSAPGTMPTSPCIEAR